MNDWIINKSRLTNMSDAAQVVEDVVKFWVGLLTCLRNQNLGSKYSSLSVKQLLFFFF